MTPDLPEVQIDESSVTSKPVIVHVCCYCHDVRDEDGGWSTTTISLSIEPEQISHCICPICFNRQMSQLDELA